MASVLKKKPKALNLKSVKIEKDWEPDVTAPPAIDDDEDDNDVPDNNDVANDSKSIVAELCKQRLISSDLELQLQQYFKEHSRVKPLPPSTLCTDIDLTDPNEETWIIQCPASIDVEAELLNKKINLTAPRSTIKHCSVPLEAQVQLNSSERVVGLQSGSRVKSFVPTGFVRITETLPPLAEPVLQDVSNDNNVTVPYPEEIRVRHPLLGYDFKEALALPKSVRKKLSLAQQKAELFYKTAPTVSKNRSSVTGPTAAQPAAAKSPSKSKKRKEPVAANVTVVPIKEEPQSPKRKKQKKDDEVETVSVKQEVTMEDDISWLLNI